MTVLFVATLWAIMRTMGTSPNVWVDTFIEDQFVEDCLVRGECTMVGPGATVGIFHSAGYLHWRTLLTWMGLGADGTYIVLLVMNALGVVLVALAARRLQGRFAAAVAGLLMIGSIGVPTQLHVISDVVPVPFLGAVFVLVAVSATMRPSLELTALLGMVGAVMANCYATGVLCGPSAVWIALLIPQRRWAHVAVAATSFAAATFLIAPGSWIMNFSLLLAQSVGRSEIPALPRPLLDIPIARLTVVASLAWAAAALGNLSLRRQLDAPAAIFVPMFFPLAMVGWTGSIDLQDKYCANVMGAVAVGVAVLAAATGRGLFRKFEANSAPLDRTPSLALPRRRSWRQGRESEAQDTQHESSRNASSTGSLPLLPSPATGESQRGGPASHLREIAERLAPYLAALAIAFGSTIGALSSVTGGRYQEAGRGGFNFGDLDSAQHILAHERGWTWPRVFRNLKVSDSMLTPATLRPAPDWPDAGVNDDLERAFLLKVPASIVPTTLPANIVVANSTNEHQALLGFACSWIDWRSFRVCIKDIGDTKETCSQSGFGNPPSSHSGEDVRLPGMPTVDPRNPPPQTMTLHIPLKPREQCPEEWVYMPRLWRLCPGRVVNVDGGGAGIDSSGRWAKLKMQKSTTGTTPTEIAIAFEIGGRECWVDYRGYPPFFVEGDPVAVDSLATILERQRILEGHGP